MILTDDSYTYIQEDHMTKEANQIRSYRHYHKHKNEVKRKAANKEYWRNCPNCDEKLFYSFPQTLSRAVKRNSVCTICSNNDPRKIAVIRSRSKELLTGRKHSRETRRKMRLAAIARIGLGGQKYPCFNSNACDIFEEINNEMGWDGQHARRRGEYHIKKLGYWVDYYEPNQNVVIEYDERAHNNNGKIEKDNLRQKEIIELLHCSFYRIPENVDWRTVVHGI